MLPSLEMLEFLGLFEDDDMGWIDPFELLLMKDAELDRLQNEEEGEEANDKK